MVRWGVYTVCVNIQLYYMCRGNFVHDGDVSSNRKLIDTKYWMNYILDYNKYNLDMSNYCEDSVHIKIYF